MENWEPQCATHLLFYVVVLGTVIAFVFWYQGIKDTPPVKTGYPVNCHSMIINPHFNGDTI